MSDKEMDKLVPEYKEIICSECGGVMKYDGGGAYVCIDCHHVHLNDYAKVRRFLEKRGPSTIMEIAVGTKLGRRAVTRLLNEGKIMLSDQSEISLSCEYCGRSIRSGILCEHCQNEIKLGHIPLDAEGNPVRPETKSYNMLAYDEHRGMRFINRHSF